MRNPEDKNLNINVRLFRRIQKMISEYPQAFDMGTWDGKAGKEHGVTMGFDPKTMKEPNCGSACCVAGWAVTLGANTSLSKFLKDTDEADIWAVSEKATELLGITDDQADAIFAWEGDHYDIDNVTAQEASEMIDRFLADPTERNL